ncbi:MAG: sensor domain-containing diguanylate cyclase [Thermodesulfovibrionia bacterium]|nr:sensor domain-containing diguanylate cyclase [Thermodesulfovibrionia bacterium]
MVISQNIVAVLIIIAAVIVLFFVYYIGRLQGFSPKENNQKTGNTDTPVFSRDVVYLEHEMSTLKTQIYNLNELNTRYFNFSQNLTEVVKQLYSSLSFDEIISTITRLINDIINTDTIEIYILDIQDNVLSKAEQFGKEINESVSYKMGEGLIGKTAQDEMIKVRGQMYSSFGDKNNKNEKEKFLMAAPIHFKDRLLGVIGIGNIKHPTGNERTLLKMISDIAGVAMVNQSHLKEWKSEAITDPLTGLYNRRYFTYRAMIEVEKAIRESTPISICMLDIDHFKHYNDTNGHQEGDRLLKIFSEQLTKLSRKTTIIARYGGEEFIVLSPDITKKDALVYTERLCEKIANYPFFNRDKQPLGFVSVSGGIASFPGDATSIDKVIKIADEALYKAKEEGRNRIIAHNLPSTFDEDES